MPIQPMIFFPYNYCTNCKTNSIEIYSWHNYAQHYDKIINQYTLNKSIPSNLDKYGIYTMRCSNCGREYKMKWENGIPVPIRGNFDEQLFMDRFRYDFLTGKPNIIDNIYEVQLENG